MAILITDIDKKKKKIANLLHPYVIRICVNRGTLSHVMYRMLIIDSVMYIIQKRYIYIYTCVCVDISI